MHKYKHTTCACTGHRALAGPPVGLGGTRTTTTTASEGERDEAGGEKPVPALPEGKQQQEEGDKGYVQQTVVGRGWAMGDGRWF